MPSSYNQKETSKNIQDVTFTSIRHISSSSTSSNTSDDSSHSTRIYPPEFGFYTTNLSDLFIALSSKSVYLYYISISSHTSLLSNNNTNKPDITLYTSPHPKNPIFSPLASVRFTGPSETPHITLGSPSFGAAPTEKVESEGCFSLTHFFSLYLPLCGVRERFEWKVSVGREVRGLGGRSKGMELVRVRSGRVVAVYVSVNLAVRKKGKMRVLREDGDGLGREFEMMAVMSLVAILEAQRRANRSAGSAAVVL
ncbi:hypothetical protein BKA64DRAFT_646338 [Cadophora sp. MPI-SDFR-AT-0126]|nr:hypothetical protein BKA64DRAFT_646338 [Leotiomycetes sp. MPI-SDFR-AT-0126]